MKRIRKAVYSEYLMKPEITGCILNISLCWEPLDIHRGGIEYRVIDSGMEWVHSHILLPVFCIY